MSLSFAQLDPQSMNMARSNLQARLVARKLRIMHEHGEDDPQLGPAASPDCQSLPLSTSTTFSPRWICNSGEVEAHASEGKWTTIDASPMQR